MKYFKLTIKAMVLCFMLTSCLEEDKMRVVEGFVYENCKKEPVSELQLSVFGNFSRVFGAGGSIYFGEITTDKNGYYSLLYRPADDKNTFNEYERIEYITQAGETIMSASYKEHIKVVHYRNLKVEHKVVIRLDDTLSNQDTIYMNVKVDDESVFFVGPFVDGQTFSIQAPFQGIDRHANEFNQSGRTSEAVFYWGLGWQEFQDVEAKTDYPQYTNHIFGVKQDACSQGDDIVIDLRGK